MAACHAVVQGDGADFPARELIDHMLNGTRYAVLSPT
jgi:hypothetical protein